MHIVRRQYMKHTGLKFQVAAEVSVYKLPPSVC